MDLLGYERFLAGKLVPYSLSDEELATSIDKIKDLPKAQMRKTGKW